MGVYRADMDDFQKMFPTEEACVDYLRALRWPKGYVCRCTSTRYWSRGRGLMICRDCGYEASVYTVPLKFLGGSSEGLGTSDSGSYGKYPVNAGYPREESGSRIAQLMRAVRCQVPGGRA
jgi:hypothetical protein